MGAEHALSTPYNYDCDVLLLSTRDVSPSITTVNGLELPLISPAFEGLRYLANSEKYVKKGPERVARHIVNRRNQELSSLHQHGVDFVLSPKQPELLAAYFKEFEERLHDNEDIMKGYERASEAFRSLLARVSAARRHLPTNQYKTMEKSLDKLVRAHQEQGISEAERVTLEDISLLAAAYDLSQIKVIELGRTPKVTLINGSPGARWLYDPDIWAQALPRRLSSYFSRTPPENLSFTHSDTEVLTDSAFAA